MFSSFNEVEPTKNEQWRSTEEWWIREFHAEEERTSVRASTLNDPIDALTLGELRLTLTVERFFARSLPS